MDASGSNSKAKKFRGETSQGQQNNVDRLGTIFPDKLVSHIMSFLPMEDAVRTAVLSKNWKYQWTNMTNLTFYDYHLHSRNAGSKELFIIYMQRSLMLLGSQKIKSFSLECIKQYDAARVHTWIIAPLRREVQKLKVYCSVKGSLAFPIHVFDYKSLTEMHFMVPCKFRVPTSFSFSNMKILHLCEVTFLNVGFALSRVLKIRFPVLKELSLWGCCWENVLRINIDAPVLSRFSIGDLEFFYDHRLSMVVNRVRKTDRSGFIQHGNGIVPGEGIALISPLSITNAAIEFSTSHLTSEHRMGMLPCGLLKQFSGLKSLTLSRKTIIDLSPLWKTEENPPSLHSTLHLTISGGTPLHCESLVNLLLHLPCLESLTVCKGNPVSEADILCGSFGDCPLPLLKVVEFLAIAGRKGELELAKFLLRNAAALEKLVIVARSSRKRERSLITARQELLGCHRASAHASIEFHQIAE